MLLNNSYSLKSPDDETCLVKHFSEFEGRHQPDHDDDDTPHIRLIGDSSSLPNIYYLRKSVSYPGIMNF